MKRVQLIGFALTLIVLCAPPGAAQDSTRIVVDHQAQRVMYHPIGAAEARPVAADDQIFVVARDRRAPIPVVIRNTNSALYTCTLKQTEVRAPALDTLSQFLSKLGPYLTTGLPLIFQTAGFDAEARARDSTERAAVREVAGQLQAELSQLNRQLHSEHGIGGVHRRAMAALNDMRRTPFGVEAGIPAGFSQWLRDAALCSGNCERLNLPESIAGTLEQVQRHRDALQDRLAEYENATLAGTSADTALTEFKEAVKRLLATADTALRDAPKTLASARAVERLALRIVNARDEIPCESTGVRWDVGKDLEITVSPRTDPELAELTARNERTYKVRVLPAWEFHPSLGLSLIAVPDAAYPTYEAVEQPDGRFRVTEAGITDSRFDFGLTLGLVNRRLDFRRERNIALWLPEITINPTEDVKLMALGAAVSYRMLKLGTGLAWTRHTVLARNSEGDLLESDDVPTRDTYGKPNLYVSLSLMGLPPFLQ